ncbi:thermonuclease family protein, partial [Candidatus Bipolaricaulota bacterium]|nr:thermonuclease family protein [Candidatus Bipolaricaulota bacterium]
MRRALIVAALAVGIAVGGVAIPPYPSPAIEAVVTYVVDGDTIEVLIRSLPSPAPAGLQAGRTVRVRYIGVDAPEVADANGINATDLNAALVQNKTVYLELDETLYDDYDRLLAYVYLDPDGYLMVNLMLVATEIIRARF